MSSRDRRLKSRYTEVHTWQTQVDVHIRQGGVCWNMCRICVHGRLQIDLSCNWVRLGLEL
jgi:hypothetical protein